jgi:hypothetical protein
MSRIAKVAFVLLAAVVAIGARQIVSSGTQDGAGDPSLAAARIAPEDFERAGTVLPATRVDSYEWVYVSP